MLCLAAGRGRRRAVTFLAHKAQSLPARHSGLPGPPSRGRDGGYAGHSSQRKERHCEQCWGFGVPFQGLSPLSALCEAGGRQNPTTVPGHLLTMEIAESHPTGFTGWPGEGAQEPAFL